MIYSQHADEINRNATHRIGRLIVMIIAVKIGLFQIIQHQIQVLVGDTTSRGRLQSSWLVSSQPHRQ